MNDRLKEVRATLAQVREAVSDATDPEQPTIACAVEAIERLTNALDVLTGEVERTDTRSQEVFQHINDALTGMLEMFKLVHKQLKVLTG